MEGSAIFHVRVEGALSAVGINHCQPCLPGSNFPEDEVVLHVAQRFLLPVNPSPAQFIPTSSTGNRLLRIYHTDSSVPIHPLAEKWVSAKNN